MLGWDSNDQLYDKLNIPAGTPPIPTATVRIPARYLRPLPFEDKMILFLGEFARGAEEVCPRGVLLRVLARADQMGYTVNPPRNSNSLPVRGNAAFHPREATEPAQSVPGYTAIHARASCCRVL